LLPENLLDFFFFAREQLLTMVEKKLSKKEQKAQAFRKKGKKNEAPEPEAFPESDLIDEDADSKPTASTGKRSREDGESGKADNETAEPRKKKNRRPKKKNQNHTGYILFVGECLHFCSEWYRPTSLTVVHQVTSHLIPLRLILRSISNQQKD
jgi:hypothetical protein